MYKLHNFLDIVPPFRGTIMFRTKGCTGVSDLSVIGICQHEDQSCAEERQGSHFEADE